MAVAVFMHESIAAPDLYVKRIMGHYTRHWMTVVGRESPLWYNKAGYHDGDEHTVVGRESPLWYNSLATGNRVRHTVVGRESPLWYNSE